MSDQGWSVSALVMLVIHTVMFFSHEQTRTRIVEKFAEYFHTSVTYHEKKNIAGSSVRATLEMCIFNWKIPTLFVHFHTVTYLALLVV